MGDILGIVANALQLADLACTIIKNSIGYYCAVRDAPSEAQSMRDEVYRFLGTIDHLQVMLQKYNEVSRIPQNIRQIEEEFKRTRTLLEEAEKCTRPKNVHGRRRFEWPLKQDRTRDIMTRIKQQRETLSLLMHGEMQFITLLPVF